MWKCNLKHLAQRTTVQCAQTGNHARLLLAGYPLPRPLTRTVRVQYYGTATRHTRSRSCTFVQIMRRLAFAIRNRENECPDWIGWRRKASPHLCGRRTNSRLARMITTPESARHYYAPGNLVSTRGGARSGMPIVWCTDVRLYPGY